MTTRAEIETHCFEHHHEAVCLSPGPTTAGTAGTGSGRGSGAHPESSTPNRTLEQARIQDFLARYLPEPPVEVADLGRGQCDRASRPTSQGYTVEFLDPPPRNIAQATAAGISAVNQALH